MMRNKRKLYSHTWLLIIARWQCLFCCYLVSKPKNKKCASWFALDCRKSSPYSQLNRSTKLTSFYDTWRHSVYVYVLNTYFKTHSFGHRWAIYFTYFLREDCVGYWTRYEWTAPLSVGCFFERTSDAVKNVFCPCRARSHTRARIHAQRGQRAKEVKRIRRGSSIGLARIFSLGLLLHTRASPHLCASHMGVQLLNCLEYIRLLRLHSQ